MSDRDATGLSAALLSIWKAIRCKYVSLSLQHVAALQLLGAHHILLHRITIGLETEDDKGFSEDRARRVEGENLQPQVRPFGLSQGR